jgi:hypothetical protein
VTLVIPFVATPVFFGGLDGRSANATAVVELGISPVNSTAWELEESDVWGIVGWLSAGWLCLFVVFLALMKEGGFRKTFWSTTTGSEWIQSVFLEGESDDVKKGIVGFNKAKWKDIEPQVKEWVSSKWLEWERTKPRWFTDNWKARVPTEWVPVEGQLEHRKASARASARISARRGGETAPRLSRLSLVLGAREAGAVPDDVRMGGDAEEGGAVQVRASSRVQPVLN